jgi:DNA-binding MarR family transcriptional regulator
LDQQALAQRLAAGLARVAVAVQATSDARSAGLERTIAQQQVLLLLARRHQAYRLTGLADELGVELAAAVGAATTLHREGLVSMDPSPADPPDQIRLELTAKGRAQAPETFNWAADLLAEMHRLDPAEQRQLLGVVIDWITTLQRRGQIPVSQMCVTCRFFDPYAHADAAQPHHCRYVDAPFGWSEVRLRCPEQQPQLPV